MTDTVPGPRAPALYWLAALVSLLWNGFGGYDYLMSRLRNLDYLTSATGSVELARQMLAMIDAMPLWAQVLWATGVWSSVLGSVLLLLRLRHAAAAFLVSLVAAALSFAYQATLTMPPGLDSLAMQVMPIVILAAIALQWWWARRKAADGTLR